MVKHVKGSKAKPETVAEALVTVLQGDATELRVGYVRAIYLMSRVAPRMVSNLINKGQDIPHVKASFATTRVSNRRVRRKYGK